MDRQQLLANLLANSQGNVLNRAFNTPSQSDVRKADLLAQQLESNRSVMSQPSNPYQLEMDRQEQGLEAPPVSPDDLIGTGLFKAVGIPLAAALGVTAIGSKAAGSKAPALANALRGQRGAIAWHGSPHKFEKFDLSKIGTGEGAQAYGHGAYLAEAKDVADQYRINLSYDPDQMKIGGQQINDYYNKLVRSADRSNNPGDLYDKAGIVERLMANEPVDSVESWANGLGVGDWFRKEIKPNFGSYGQLYKTDIPDEAVARFLDWDKPLSQQAPEVQAAWEKFISSRAGKSADKSLRGAILNKEGQFADPTGKDIYGAMSEGLIGFGKARPFNQVKAEASEILAKRKIPGIRYLDAGSRDSAQGTSNYVIFDPEMIRILERNNEATGLQPWNPGEYDELIKAMKGRR